MVPVDKEERMIILYALVRCGGKGTHGRIIDVILDNQLMEHREGDDDIRSNGKRAIVNDLEFARQDLKDLALLSMPKHGTWAITDAGRERFVKFARSLSSNRALWEDGIKKGELRRTGTKFLDAVELLVKEMKL